MATFNFPKSNLEKTSSLLPTTVENSDIEKENPVALSDFERVVFLNLNKEGKSIQEFFENSSSLQEQYGIDISVATKHESCMVCSLPRKILELLEKDLFKSQTPFASAAVKYRVTPADINKHVDECVLNRRVTIPAGALMGTLVYEIQEFIQRMSMFRLMVDSDYTPETVSSYLSVISELRLSIKDLIKLDSPEDNASLIVKQIFNPLIRSQMRELATCLNAAKEKLMEECILPNKKEEATKIFKSFVEKTSSGFSTRLTLSLVKYSELMGIQPETLLGTELLKNVKINE